MENQDGKDRKLKVVDGQIILLDAETIDEMGVPPLEHLYKNWDIGMEFSVS